MNAVKKYSGLAAWIVTCFIAAAIGAFFEPGIWYEALEKPIWTPPNWIFPIVWPLLYTLMAVSAWLIWTEFGFQQARQALMWFGFQLILNAAWSWLFFGEHLIGTALGEILLLWIAILFTMMLFWKKNKVAGWLMLPYLLWVSYASALNFAIFQLN
jgi:tryptophan-rich sensory protein